MKRVKEESGFTMIELMITLFVIVIITSFGYPHFQTFLKHKKTDYFLERLKSDISKVQQKAIVENKSYSLVINAENHYYEIQNEKLQSIGKVEVPQYIEIETFSMPLKIQFNQQGNIRRAGTIYLHTDDANYKMVFQIGKGKFYVTKQ